MKLRNCAPLEEGQYYLLDGGFSTQLSKYVQGVDSDPLWTARSLVDNKEAVVRVTRDWLAAGARDWVSAELFAEQLGLSRQQTWEHVVDSVSLAVRAVQEEAGVLGHTLVAGSVGPYGACLHDGSEYSGHYLQGDNAVTHERLVEWHRDRIQALQEGGVSFLAVETIPMSCEALAVLDCISGVGLLSAWVSFSLKDEDHLAGGETVENAIRRIKNHQLAREGRIVAVGFNCSAPQHITGALKAARKAWSDVPFVVYPNSGEKWTRGSWSRVDTDVSWMEMIPGWIRLGAVIVGGCCRVDADTLPKIREQIGKGILSK